MRAVLVTIVALTLVSEEAGAFNSKYHHDITIQALQDAGITDQGAQHVVVAANWLTDRFSNPLLRRVMTEIAARAADWSIDKLSDTAKSLGQFEALAGLKFAEFVLEKIRECKVGDDLPTFRDDKAIVAANRYHFDNLDTADKIENEFKNLRDKTIEFLETAKRPSEKDVLIVLGITLHAIQDFYSHSNWVEEASGIVDIDNIKIPAKVKTGYTNPSCDLKGKDSHDEMNHDKPGLQGRDHGKALSLALVASRQWIKKFKGWAKLTGSFPTGNYNKDHWGALTDVYSRRSKAAGTWDDSPERKISVFGPNSFENEFESKFKRVMYRMVQIGGAASCGAIFHDELYKVCDRGQMVDCSCESCGLKCSEPKCKCVKKPEHQLLNAGLPNEPVLTSVTFRSNTGGDNKDKDTSLSVTLFTRDGKTPIAYAHKVQGNVEYEDESEHSFDVPVSATVAKSQCANFKFRVDMFPNGTDEWNVDGARVVLKFNDGSQVPRSVGAFKLNAQNDKPKGKKF